MNNEEMCIEVNERNEKIGLMPRKDFYKSDHIHRTVHLILLNSKRKILIQKRASDKKLYPNLYTFSVDGTVNDETVQEAIKREVKEEIGLDIPVKELFTFPCFDDVDKAFHTVFIGESDDKIIPDPREIQKIKWVDPDELKKGLDDDPIKYTTALVEGMKIFFEEYHNRSK